MITRSGVMLGWWYCNYRLSETVHFSYVLIDFSYFYWISDTFPCSSAVLSYSLQLKNINRISRDVLIFDNVAILLEIASKSAITQYPLSDYLTIFTFHFCACYPSLEIDYSWQATNVLAISRNWRGWGCKWKIQVNGNGEWRRPLYPKRRQKITIHTVQRGKELTTSNFFCWHLTVFQASRGNTFLDA